MGLFKRIQYELIDDAVPRRGQKKLLIFTVCGIGILTISMLVILLYLNFIKNPPAELNTTSTTEITFESSIYPIDIDKVLEQTNRNRLKASGSANEPQNAADAEAAADNVILSLDYGTLRGKYMKSRSGRNFLAFLGIPYAKPPTGELRFKPTLAAEPWNGTLDATQFKPDCLQKDKYNTVLTTKGSEDCLYLNVFTSKNLSELSSNGRNTRRNLYPVLFCIHGGGQYGSGNRYGPDYMMDENVLLVTVHYRLGILGNLNTNDSEARGNQGMKDQVIALQWIQDNIKKFGGDPKKVTIFGNSYGGTEVGGHLISPMSKGLFQRAIMQSGTMLEVEKYPKNTLELAYELGNKLNCSNNINGRSTSSLSSSDLINCFNNVDIDTLILQSYQMNFEMSIEALSSNNAEENPNTFLSDSPLNILQRGEVNPASVMAGTSSGEGLFVSLLILADNNLTKYFNEHWENAAIKALQLESATDPIKIVNLAKEFYFGNATLNRNVEANFTNMCSDRSLVHQTYTAATFQLAFNNNNRDQNVYLYYFNKDADKTYAQPVLDIYGNDNSTFLGAGHADELQFLFPYKEYPYIPQGSKNANFSKMIVKLWATFADTGKPSSGVENGEEWLAISNPKPYQWFLIEDEPKMIDWLGPRMEFWDQFNLTDLYRY